MSKYYDKKIPIEINVVYGGRQSGKTYYEFNKLKEEYNILKENNVELFKSYERLVNRIGKTLKYIEELYKMTKEQDSDNVNLIDRLEIILKILKEKKMKVIDLLNKIANGEEVPKKIKYENYIYWYDKKWKDYKNAQVEFSSYLISCKYHTTDFLNDEVEIIEDTPKEDKKIEKFNVIKDDMNRYETIQYKGIFYDVGSDINTFDAILADKINEIIDKINGGK